MGQQQRLPARTLAGEPEVILMDEPTSALDPRSTQAIEELVRAQGEHAIVVVSIPSARSCRRRRYLTAITLAHG